MHEPHNQAIISLRAASLLLIAAFCGACLTNRGDNPYDPLHCNNACASGLWCYLGECVAALSDGRVEAGADGPRDDAAQDLLLDTRVDLRIVDSASVDTADLVSHDSTRDVSVDAVDAVVVDAELDTAFDLPADTTFDLPADTTSDTVGPTDATPDGPDGSVDTVPPPLCGYDEPVAVDVLDVEGSRYLNATPAPIVFYFDKSTSQLRAKGRFAGWQDYPVPSVTGNRIAVARTNSAAFVLVYRSAPNDEIYIVADIGSSGAPVWSTPEKLLGANGADLAHVTSFDFCIGSGSASGHIAITGQVYDTGQQDWEDVQLLYRVTLSTTLSTTLVSNSSGLLSDVRLGCGGDRVVLSSAQNGPFYWNVGAYDYATSTSLGGLIVNPTIAAAAPGPLAVVGESNNLFHLFFAPDVTAGLGPLSYYTWIGAAAAAATKVADPLVGSVSVVARSVDADIDSQGRPHVVYRQEQAAPQSAKLIWSYENGLNWQAEVVASDVGPYAQIGIESGNEANFSWTKIQGGQSTLMHSCRVIP